MVALPFDSDQKWNMVFDYLVKFIAESKAEETNDMSEEEIQIWQWDGNVPTTFKSKDGKALGRWVNNQRSAKSKGVLKDDRENRLVNAGLKWSVLASNSWNEMLEELRIYVNDQVRTNKLWCFHLFLKCNLESCSPRFFLSDKGRQKMGREW
jgi:hypothetical protein